MGDLGYLALAGALLLAAFAALASLLGAISGRADLQESGWRALLGACALVVGAALTLVVAFQLHDFSLRYVAENSSTLMSPIDILASFWGGQAGSLLFWTTGLAVSSALCATRSSPAGASRRSRERLRRWRRLEASRLPTARACWRARSESTPAS